ncbi:MFS transporter [Pseudoduganella flava]|uniref:MFS transporter n=1 Tax=Pseudoduganella flava TaxID=871742 RepID=A0ABX6G0B9_9BURK|nr:MFS transporter [Pseudoduganella flava]
MLADPNFRRYWANVVLTSFGAQIGAMALPLCAALLLHATPAQMGILTASQAIPFALFALPAGVLLDRSRKLPILLASKAVNGLALASIAVAWWLDLLGMPWLYLVAATVGTCSVIGGGADQIFLTLLVGRDRIIEAQSRFITTDSISRLLAPGLAGVLIQALTAPVAILVDAATFFICLRNLTQMTVREPAPVPSDKHPLRDIHDGFLFIGSQPLLRTLAWLAGFWHVIFYGYQALLVLYATRDLGLSAGMLGATNIVGGAGVLASSFLLRTLNRRWGAGITMLCGIASTALGFVLVPTIPANLFGTTNGSAAALAVLTFFVDCGVILFLVPYTSLRQKITPDEMLGRMVSTMRFLTVAVAPLGALAAGYLADRFGLRAALYCVAGGGLLLTAAMLSSRAIRGVRP